MHFGDAFYGLQFNNHYAVDDEIRPKTFLELDAVVFDGHRYLPLHFQPPAFAIRVRV